MTERTVSTKSFYLDQHGCAKNQVDGELIISLLEDKGWLRTEQPESARVIIINSCGFIESAKKESLDALFSARKAYPDAKIILAGCLAERYADIFKQDLPEADAVFGNGDLSKLDFLMNVLEKGLRPVVRPEQKGVCCGERKAFLGFPSSAYVKITEGCNNRCSFCAIPLIRGVLRSRSADDIVDEIRGLRDRGIFEFNLIGQDLAAFGRDGVSTGDSANALYFQSPSPLSLLLQKIGELEGDFWLRLLYIHPDHFPLDILPIMTADKRFLPYFDIPFQSGAQKIIRAMNRNGSAEVYLDIVKNIRDAFEKAKSPYGEPQIRTTFLVGFPGETDEDFNETIKFLKELRPLWSGGFTYSREEDTPSYSFKEKVPKKTAEARLAEIQNTQTSITEKKLDSFIGKEIEVLVEELIQAEDKAFLALGRAWFQAPEVDGAVVLNFNLNKKDIDGNPIAPGSIVKARIAARNGFDLEALAV